MDEFQYLTLHVRLDTDEEDHYFTYLACASRYCRKPVPNQEYDCPFCGSANQDQIRMLVSPVATTDDNGYLTISFDGGMETAGIYPPGSWKSWRTSIE